MSRSTRWRAASGFSLLVLSGCLIGASTAHATKYAAEFLKTQVGARAIGMGGAFTAVPAAPPPLWGEPARVDFPPPPPGLPPPAPKVRQPVHPHSLPFG